jgi:hypothetical protein
MNNALQMIDISAGSSSWDLGLGLLAPLPDEILCVDVDRQLRDELEEKILSSSTVVFHKLNQLCTMNYGEKKFCVRLISTLHAWLNQGLSLTKLCTDYAQFFSFVCTCIKSSTDSDVLRTSFTFVQDIMAVSDYPRTEIRNSVVVQIVQMLHSHEDSLLDRCFVHTKKNVGNEFCNMLCGIATSELQMLCASPNEFFGTVLKCVSMRPRSLLEITYDFWLELQDVPSEEKHSFIGQLVIPSLLRVIIEHARLIQSQSYEDDEMEDLDTFRDVRLGLPDVLGFCLNGAVPKEQFFSILQDSLTAASTACDLYARWRELEVVLFILATTSNALKDLLQMAKSTELISWIHNFTAQTLHAATEDSSTLVSSLDGLLIVETLCKYLGSITYLLVKHSEFEVLFAQACHFLLRLLGIRHQTSISAAKSLHQLFVHGRKLLTINEGLQSLPVFVSVFVNLLNSRFTNHSSLLIFTEALVRIVVSLSHPNGALQQHLIHSICEPIIIAMQNEIALDSTASAKRIFDIVSVASQLIRFCDQQLLPVSLGDCSLNMFLSRLWPLLEYVTHSPLLTEDTSTVLFELFGRLFTSLGSRALPVLDKVTVLMVTALSSGEFGCQSAIKCATVIVEVVSTDRQIRAQMDYSVYLKNLLENVVSSLLGNVDFSKFVQNHDCAHEFFDLIRCYTLFCPMFLAASLDCLDVILSLASNCLNSCWEREVVRSVLQVLQYGFCPSNLQSVDVHELAWQKILIEQFQRHGKRVLSILLIGISCGRYVSALASHISDVLLSVFTGCQLKNKERDFQSWLEYRLLDLTYFDRFESNENRILVVNLMLCLAAHNTRRFKAFIQDILSICSSELSVDCLFAYSDCLNITLHD